MMPPPNTSSASAPISSDFAQMDHICEAHISTAMGGRSSVKSLAAERRTFLEDVLKPRTLRRRQAPRSGTSPRGDPTTTLLPLLSAHGIALRITHPNATVRRQIGQPCGPQSINDLPRKSRGRVGFGRSPNRPRTLVPVCGLLLDTLLPPPVDKPCAVLRTRDHEACGFQSE